MLRTYSSILALCIGITAATPLLGQESFTILFDQDNFLLSKQLNEDRNYTQATAFAWTGPSADHLGVFGRFFFLPHRAIDALLGVNSIGTSFCEEWNFRRQNVSFIWLGSGFTPEKLDSREPIVGDRPYASLIGIKTTTTYRLDGPDRWADSYHTTKIQYGLFGTHVGKSLQTFAHKYMIQGRPVPLGWSTQVSDGGHPAFLIGYDMLKPIYSTRLKWLDGGINLGADYGFLKRVYAGGLLRVGLLDHEDLLNWSNQINIGSSQNKELVKSDLFMEKWIDSSVVELEHFPTKQRRWTEIFAIAKLTPNYIFRNAMLQGQPNYQRWQGGDPYLLTESEINHFIYDLQIGLGTTFRSRRNPEKYISFSYLHNTRSPEFKSDQFERFHHWGTFLLTVPI